MLAVRVDEYMYIFGGFSTFSVFSCAFFFLSLSLHFFRFTVWLQLNIKGLLYLTEQCECLKYFKNFCCSCSCAHGQNIIHERNRWHIQYTIGNYEKKKFVSKRKHLSMTLFNIIDCICLSVVHIIMYILKRLDPLCTVAISTQLFSHRK